MPARSACSEPAHERADVAWLRRSPWDLGPEPEGRGIHSVLERLHAKCSAVHDLNTRKQTIVGYGLMRFSTEPDVAAFVRALKREKLSRNSITSYETAVLALVSFLAARGYPKDIRRIEARHIDAWIRDLLARHQPATVRNQFRGARRFFDWYAGRNASFASPMLDMHPPRPSEYARVLNRDQQRDVVRACRGTTFEDRRDLALVRVFFDTAALRAEVANLRHSPADIDLKRGTVRIVDNRKQERTASLAKTTVAALDNYLRARRTHPHAALPWLWLGKTGCLDDSAVGRALRARGIRAGIPDLHRLGHGLWVAH